MLFFWDSTFLLDEVQAYLSHPTSKAEQYQSMKKFSLQKAGSEY